MQVILPSNIIIIPGEPERAPNTRETGSGVYIIIYIVRDLAWQRLNAHAQTPRGSLPLTGKGRHQRRSKAKSVVSVCSVARAQGPWEDCGACYWVTFDLIHLEL